MVLIISIDRTEKKAFIIIVFDFWLGDFVSKTKPLRWVFLPQSNIADTAQVSALHSWDHSLCMGCLFPTHSLCYML